MTLSWNEIKTRSIAFSKEWENTIREEADAKPFLVEFLNIFGISHRRVATFEHRVKKLNSADGYIDLLWKGMLLVEMKSRGKDLEKAYTQAKDYCAGLKEYELPKLILISDFYHFHLYDENGGKTIFTLADLGSNVQAFNAIAGYEKRIFKEQDPVNIEAAELMGKLHDKLKANGYTGHQLELFLVRLLFCLFADDTGIFDKHIFFDYIALKTNEDGSDLAAHISQLFQILNTPADKRLKNLDETLLAFPFVNGKLFEEAIPMAGFDSDMRNNLLKSCRLDWGKISPAIFGSLFQSVMDAKARRNFGAHYTSEKNILKLIKPLFLDELWKEFEAAKSDKRRLQKLHEKISKLRFLDPACGCGNFLIIAYRELRLVELELVKHLLKGQQVTSINDYFLIDVNQFYGIEYEEFPSQIAQVALWLMDHQMNEAASIQFGQYFKRIPLKKSATIVCGNALQIDWQSLLQKESTMDIYAEVANVFEVNEPIAEYKVVNIYTKQLNTNPVNPSPINNIRYNYILGNPPFIGKHLQNAAQRVDMELIFKGVNGAGVFDYVAAWYLKSAIYITAVNKIETIELPKTKVAFVSTNSISQGEQVGVLWNELFNKYKIKIHFAHRSFKWGNEAKGNAAVHVVIIGFSNFDINEKFIYEYEDAKGGLIEVKAKNINPYLVEGKDLFLNTRRKPICKVPEMLYGNKIVDGGFYLFSDDEKKGFLINEPNAKELFKPILSGDEFINGKNRWVLYLKDIGPLELRGLPKVKERVEAVKEYREKSAKKQTQQAALTPAVFAEQRQPKENFLLIPRTSSENRRYIPLGFFTPDYIVNDSCTALPNATNFEFGILSSLMHMAWVKTTCGRLKSDFRYSNTIVYNNFPWPENTTAKQREAIEKAAQLVLDVRKNFMQPAIALPTFQRLATLSSIHNGASLADLYDPITMPAALVKAHQQLDKAVDLCYRSQPFINETKRIEFLFELYDKYTMGLFVQEKKSKKK